MFPNILPSMAGAVGAGAVASALMKDAPREDDTKFWVEFGWIEIPDGPDRNLDALEPRRLPEHGCPTCGGVWTSLLGLGFRAPRVYGGRLADNDPERRFAITRRKELLLEAVEVECFSGHRFRYHEFTRRLIPSPQLPAGWIASFAPMMLFGALGYIAAAAVASFRKP